MKVEKKELSILGLIQDLNSGLTWFKSEDVGNGSIQQKYGANDAHINIIKQHPKLVNVEPCMVQFVLIDDTETKSPVEEVIAEAVPIQKEVATDIAEETGFQGFVSL